MLTEKMALSESSDLQRDGRQDRTPGAGGGSCLRATRVPVGTVLQGCRLEDTARDDEREKQGKLVMPVFRMDSPAS
jgi:hypothetical protein